MKIDTNSLGVTRRSIAGSVTAAALLIGWSFSGVAPATAGVPNETAGSVSSDVALEAQLVRPLLIGATVPNVAVLTVTGEVTSLWEAVGKKPTLLLFYRGGW